MFLLVKSFLWESQLADDFIHMSRDYVLPILQSTQHLAWRHISDHDLHLFADLHFMKSL